ncbi:APC family permease [Dactylosporangium cerinum]|uniref:APC family permease n=1 Tax=Dactylosporangium cerinum TaxID=1434730 RepID=A0ABV9WH80_9ACTN
MRAAGLIRRHINGFNAWQFMVGATSPMAVLVGGVVNTYATTGVLGTPLAFLIVGGALALLMVGYLAMTNREGNAAPAYAFLGLGLGPSWGIAGGVLMFAATNAIQISLYGLFGATTAELTGVGHWTGWALAAWVLVAVFGLANFSLGKVFIAVVGVAELVMIGAVILAAFTHPHDGQVSTAPMTVGALWDQRAMVGGVFALTVAAFVGVESGAAYAEEGRTDKTMVHATAVTLLVLPVLYCAMAWALPVWTGPDQIVGEARNAGHSGFPFTIVAAGYGGGMVALAQLLMLTSFFISALSFHQVIGRYVHAIAREGVIPAWLADVGRLGGCMAGATAPASLLQSGIALAVIGVCALLRVDPIGGMFIWLSSGAAVGVLVTLVGVSIATVFYFRKGGGGRRDPLIVRTAGPVLGAIVGSALVAVIVVNQSALLGVTSVGLQAVIPLLVLVTIVAGFWYARRVRRLWPDRYAAVGMGRPDEVVVPDQQVGFRV